jgi:hypothetical protein
LCGLADANRQLGDLQLATDQLQDAARMQAEGGFQGDLAWNQTCQAKLEPDRAQALALLARAKAMQSRLGDRMGRTRTLLLEARLVRHAPKARSRKAMLTRLRNDIPALRVCPLFARIMNAWDDWVWDNSSDEHGDTFWGL